MQTRLHRSKGWWFILLISSAILSARPAAGTTVAFLLNNITYSNTSGLYGTSTGDGMIAWTYNPGDFQNGTGIFLFVNLPPDTIYPSSSYGPIYTVDASTVTGTITQNVDTYWYDYSISYSPALSGPDSSATITGDSYDLYGNNPGIGFSGNFLGKVIGGTITPYCPTLSVLQTGTNIVVSWPTNYADGFILESAVTLEPGNSWTTSSVPAIVLGQNYVATNSMPGSNTFFRLIR